MANFCNRPEFGYAALAKYDISVILSSEGLAHFYSVLFHFAQNDGLIFTHPFATGDVKTNVAFAQIDM